MELHFYPPSPLLAPFVAAFWTYYDDALAPIRVVPSGAAQLVIDLSGAGLRLPTPLLAAPAARGSRGTVPALFHGVDSVGFLVDDDQPHHEFGVDFRPGGLYPFFAAPADELHDVHLPLDTLWGGRVVRELCERVAQACTLEERAGILERVLLHQLAHRLQHHPAVSAALRALTAPLGKYLDDAHTSSSYAPYALISSPTPGNHLTPSKTLAHEVRIAQVAEAAGFSVRRLRTVFAEEVGLKPKHYARVRRFFETVLRIQARTEREVNWARVAVECGYYDQSHLIKDFYAFVGVRPGAYLRKRVDQPATMPPL